MADTDEVVSGATETPPDEGGESSSDDTQATQETPVEKPDYRRLLKEDPDLRSVFDSELQRALSKRERAALRAAARQAADSQDNETAMHITRRVADEQDDDDIVDAGWAREVDETQPYLQRITGINKDGLATNEWYVKMYDKYGKPEMDRRYGESPSAFLSWVEDEIQDMRLDAKLKKVAPSLAEAMATDQVNQQLRRTGAPLTGGSGSSALTPESYDAMTREQRDEIRRKNPKAIDEMVARYTR